MLLLNAAICAGSSEMPKIFAVSPSALACGNSAATAGGKSAARAPPPATARTSKAAAIARARDMHSSLKRPIVPPYASSLCFFAAWRRGGDAALAEAAQPSRGEDQRQQQDDHIKTHRRGRPDISVGLEIENEGRDERSMTGIDHQRQGQFARRQHSRHDRRIKQRRR